MYESYYNFARLPFENTPDPRFFFASEQHREALAAIEYTIRMRKGIVLVTGDIGSGKTTIGQTMVDRCRDSARIVPLSHGHRHRSGLVRQVLRAFNQVTRPGTDHVGLLEQLHRQLVAHLNENRPVVLLVDEAQTLSDEALEELRLLSNFEAAGRKLLQLVLIGQPELRSRIAEPRFDALRQRIVMAKQLHALSLAETGAYIAHRIAAASTDAEHPAVAFNTAAVAALYHVTGGVPRLINIAADNCLLFGYVREKRVIEPGMVDHVVQDMIPSFEDTQAPAPTNGQPLSLAIAG